MFRKFIEFQKDDEGAVTVDWVVLTAAVVGLGIAVVTTIGKGALDQSTGVGARLSVQSIATY
ncbi:hypothetical protein EU803_02095 [Loktanella sp. IMCC34160]|uniref:hypothetical protein n=1 Tax=Loktanella sp. IMCC34160 TaxID=2510646 RepID=UPI00101D798B|nr:hypothetical protein [Loktanella sp. IMCC34160]RYG92920.1 hypothetical protein EU803_02095 [Loktanella sp. IMCC34160]